MLQLLSILVLTFALTLIFLGLLTLWLERGPGRWQGIAIALLGLLIGSGYALLASRYSLILFGRLIVLVDLPRLLATAFAYTVGVIGGAGLAMGLFLWVTGKYRSWQIRRRLIALVMGALLLGVLLTFLAIWLSRKIG
ncbi:MAG: hypothetical protein RMK65_00675 [Anaerolineae bacterium]|nr:hypothetical protein [Anaerolineae bacterium]MDW7990669.1 hypothetical protein [Anaerolineae bacterium]